MKIETSTKNLSPMWKSIVLTSWFYELFQLKIPIKINTIKHNYGIFNLKNGVDKGIEIFPYTVARQVLEGYNNLRTR